VSLNYFITVLVPTRSNFAFKFLSMKKLLKCIFLVLLLLPALGIGQCNMDDLTSKFAPKLEEFVYITSFKIQNTKDGDKTSYSYVLSRGTTYKIVVCDENQQGNRMIVNFLDRNKKLIATNYLKTGKKFFPTINYSCQVTGVYYVEAYFENDKKGCGLNLLGFKKE
jgi:hypothetical protein